MGTQTKIEWCDHTFNAWRGCVKVAGHPACDHCYADAMSKRNPQTLGTWGDATLGGKRVVAADEYWRLPAKWNRQAAATAKRKTVFALSLGDVCEDWRGPMHDHCGNVLALPADEDLGGRVLSPMDSIRAKLSDTIDATEHLIWLLLTKRPGRIGECFGYRLRNNVLWGTSVSDQATLESYWDAMTSDRGPWTGNGVFLSIEPLLSEIDLWQVLRNGPAPAWIIAGGESGPHARPCHPAWVRRIRDDCARMEIPFFFKQWGEWLPRRQRTSRDLTSDTWGTLTRDGTFLALATPWNGHDDDGETTEAAMMRVGKKRAGAMLEGRIHVERPAWFDKPLVNWGTPRIGA